MSVLIDTSAWIEFFRATGDPATKSRVAKFVSLGEAAYTCPVRFELFLGARLSEIDDLREGLGLARRLAVTPAHWDAAAKWGAKLRSQGLTIPASDLLIAAVATEHGIPLLSLDTHFLTIQEHILQRLELI